MDRLIDTAAKTPFDLSGIASSAKQMLAYGSTVDNVVDELVMLGNVASRSHVTKIGRAHV